MTTSPCFLRILKGGGLVLIDSGMAVVQRIIVLQVARAVYREIGK